MRGADEQSGSMFSYLSPEERVPQDHPLRAIRRMTDRALARLSPRFGTLYVKFGRPSERATGALPDRRYSVDQGCEVINILHVRGRA